MKYFVCFLFLLSSLQGDGFEDGIEFINQKDYLQASKHFHHAAESGNSAALFGEVICALALGNQEIADKHLQVLGCATCKNEEQNLSPAEKTEQEHLSAYNCRQSQKSH